MAFLKKDLHALNMAALCPKCEKPIVQLQAVSVPIKAQSGAFDGTLLICPLCLTAIGASLDPIVLKDAIVAEAVAAIRHGRG